MNNENGQSVFILAAGAATRCDGVIKQLLAFRGEALILRTIRLCKEVGVEPAVLTVHAEIKKLVPKWIEPQKNDWVTSTQASARPYWQGQVVYLWGDAIYSHKTIAHILNYRGGLRFFINKGEIIGLSFEPKDYEFIYEKMLYISANAQHYKVRGKTWALYRHLQGPENEKVIGPPYGEKIDDSTTDIDSLKEYYDKSHTFFARRCFDEPGKKNLRVYLRGGIGDCLCGEVGIRRYAQQNPDADIIVGCAWPELYINHPAVKAVTKFKRDCDMQIRPHKFSHITKMACRALGVDETVDIPKLYIGDYIYDGVKELGLCNYIAIAPEANKSIRNWTKDKWQVVIDYLSRQRKVVIIGSQKEDYQNCCDLSGKTSVLQAAAIIESAELFIGTESGMAHVAAATGTKAIVLFGPTAPSHFGHKGLTYPVVGNKCTRCWPCYAHLKACPIRTHECMESITPEMVIDKVNEVLYGTAVAV
ncbi:MAG TPA: glycosyltransferase family 9 protein [Candidatus Staskawiczbacteria bacterium]|nr:glycosyltransferase family 9 protein [Candidatus Staskawiczbacteria bacterium]